MKFDNVLVVQGFQNGQLSILTAFHYHNLESGLVHVRIRLEMLVQAEAKFPDLDLEHQTEAAGSHDWTSLVTKFDTLGSGPQNEGVLDGWNQLGGTDSLEFVIHTRPGRSPCMVMRR
ncbi:hypothetical protein TCAL_16317 [Tigriopus californicus]|uniref:Uncharacterized protein n=1 Tax=Tigriopus californicus TaxID=6832 RepID=A0A553N6R9_TIGCA|nr:hypothetical protein TCAL_16317 [Tigriopus californicus]